MSSPVVVAAVVSAAVAGLFKLGNDSFLLEREIQRRYAQEERKKLRSLIGEYQGRLIEAALDWRRRMGQIYRGEYRLLDPRPEHWHDDEEYYFQSVVYRFVQLMAIARRFEAEAFYIDPRIASDDDFDLFRYAKAFLWVMVHPELAPDDDRSLPDRFRSDSFRPMLDFCYATPLDADGRPLLPETRDRRKELLFDRPRYMAIVRQAGELGHEMEFDELLRFFAGIRPDDYLASTGQLRRRWDRMVTLHLFVLAFLAKCGYAWQSSDLSSEVQSAADMLLYPREVAAQLALWAPELGLSEGLREVRDALEAAADRLPVYESSEQRECRVRAHIGCVPRTGTIRSTARSVSSA